MNQPRLYRRHVLTGAVGLGIGAVFGCQPKAGPAATEEVVSVDRIDVPLRIVIVGMAGQEDSEAIRRAWSAVTEQPLAIESVSLDRADLKGLSRQVRERAKKSDLVIYPLSLVADLVAAEVIVPLTQSEFGDLEKESGALFPALRNGAAQYGGEYYSLPLGAAQPALLSQAVQAEPHSKDQSMSWQDYDAAVEAWEGVASEPAVPGWAGAMFLWRTSEIQSWLFSRETLVPTVTAKPYVDALELMVRTNRRYNEGPMAPDQIWQAVADGKLKGGIGFPVLRNGTSDEIQVDDLPGGGSLSRVLLDPFSTVLSISANCRQSKAAKRFANWIGGEAAGDTMRNGVSGITVVRDMRGPNGTTNPSPYEQWLAGRLKTPVIVPNLQILKGGDYYEVLDQQVTRAIEGEVSSKEALTQVAESWLALNEDVGVDKQRRAWQRAQGMS